MSESRRHEKHRHDDVASSFDDLRHRPEPFVDAQHAGNFLQLSRRRVLQLARQGKLPAYPIGKGVRRVCDSASQIWQPQWYTPLSGLTCQRRKSEWHRDISVVG